MGAVSSGPAHTELAGGWAGEPSPEDSGKRAWKRGARPPRAPLRPRPPHLGPPPGDLLPELGQRRGEAGEERGVRGREGGVAEEFLGRRPHLGHPGRPSAARDPVPSAAEPPPLYLVLYCWKTMVAPLWHGVLRQSLSVCRKTKSKMLANLASTVACVTVHGVEFPVGP